MVVEHLFFIQGQTNIQIDYSKNSNMVCLEGQSDGIKLDKNKQIYYEGVPAGEGGVYIFRV
jgi:hypothetical protein